jgi:hypothetical protein
MLGSLASWAVRAVAAKLDNRLGASLPVARNGEGWFARERWATLELRGTAASIFMAFPTYHGKIKMQLVVVVDRFKPL